MNDEDRQAERLRERLDHELSGLRTTVEARERLDSRISPTVPTQRMRWNVRRLPVVLALPLAAAAVVVAVVTVPGLLRQDTEIIPPAGGFPTGRITATSAPAPVPDRTPGPVPSPVTADQSQAAPDRTAPDPLQVTLAARSIKTGERAVLTLTGVSARTGDLTVTWDDDTSDTVVRGDCSTRSEVTTEPLAHVYRRPGQHVVRVTIDGCGSAATQRAEVPINVTSAPTAARPR